jgi:RNA polymerase sigma-70 factor, ECF subfamily
LVRRHRTKLFRFLTFYLGNSSDAEDIVQDTLVRAYQASDRYDPGQSFTTWLFVIGRRLAANERRRLGRLRKRQEELQAEPTENPVFPSDAGNLWAHVKTLLSETAFTTIWLHYGEDYPVKEIAQILGKTATSVKVTLFRARRILSRELDAKLVSESMGR